MISEVKLLSIIYLLQIIYKIASFSIKNADKVFCINNNLSNDMTT